MTDWVDFILLTAASFFFILGIIAITLSILMGILGGRKDK